MTRTVRTLFPLAVLVSGGALAQVSPVAPEERNAALKYWAAWSLMSPEAGQKSSDIDWAGVGSETDPGALPALVREASEAGRSATNALVAASRLARCDFEIEYEKGVGVLLPHLSKARQGARLLRADARWLLAEGKPDECAERIAAMFRTAAHLRHDRLMISSLVGVAIGSIATEEAKVLLGSGRLTGPGRDAILRATEGLDPADPFDVGKTLETERVVFTRWMRANFTGPAAGRRLVEEVGGLAAAGDSSVAQAAQMAVSTMDGAALSSAFDELDRYYAEAQRAWPGPDAAAALGALTEAVERNEYGPLALVLAPALNSAREGATKAAVRLADLRRALEAYDPGKAAVPAPLAPGGEGR